MRLGLFFFFFLMERNKTNMSNKLNNPQLAFQQVTKIEFFGEREFGISTRGRA